ncbi:hypothetical protein EJ08DRAFT_228900 [Tothia fuscella]|uniref:Uncharacterized protein n=1 Tax=Tothia fuscella TaxID=1048955 RepID=A0A9P4P0W8_9PEZI|nr:hypothetical protein EJ08DRAFT_228900 [Tothia fuscella]
MRLYTQFRLEYWLNSHSSISHAALFLCKELGAAGERLTLYFLLWVFSFAKVQSMPTTHKAYDNSSYVISPHFSYLDTLIGTVIPITPRLSTKHGWATSATGVPGSSDAVNVPWTDDDQPRLYAHASTWDNHIS